MKNCSRFLVVFTLLIAASTAQAEIWNPFSWGGRSKANATRHTATAPGSARTGTPSRPQMVGPGELWDKLSDSTRAAMKKTQEAFTWEPTSRASRPQPPERSELRSVRSQGGKGKGQRGGSSLLPGWMKPSNSRPEKPPTLHSWLGQPRPE